MEGETDIWLSDIPPKLKDEQIEELFHQGLYKIGMFLREMGIINENGDKEYPNLKIPKMIKFQRSTEDKTWASAILIHDKLADPSVIMRRMMALSTDNEHMKKIEVTKEITVKKAKKAKVVEEYYDDSWNTKKSKKKDDWYY